MEATPLKRKQSRLRKRRARQKVKEAEESLLVIAGGQSTEDEGTSNIQEVIGIQVDMLPQNSDAQPVADSQQMNRDASASPGKTPPLYSKYVIDKTNSC